MSDGSPPISTHPPRRGLMMVFLGLLLLVSVFAGLCMGPTTINAIGILGQWLLGGETPAGVESWHGVVLWQVRFPRVLLAVLVGGGLGLAGAVMQGIFRNPMADPGIIGVSGGASLGAVIAIYSGLARIWVFYLPLLSFAGACFCAFTVYLIATVRGKTSVVALLLAGIAIGGIASSLTSFVLTLSLPQWGVGQEIVRWLMGGLESKTWTDVKLGAPLILGCAFLLMFYGRELDVLSCGEEVAQTLGLDVPRSRRQILILATAITASAVSVSGTLVFVGLLVPHILRLLIGPGHFYLMIASFLGGAILLVLSDLVARTVLAPEEMRLGVITSLLGGPFFLYLLVARKTHLEGL